MSGNFAARISAKVQPACASAIEEFATAVVRNGRTLNVRRDRPDSSFRTPWHYRVCAKGMENWSFLKSRQGFRTDSFIARTSFQKPKSASLSGRFRAFILRRSNIINLPESGAPRVLAG